MNNELYDKLQKVMCATQENLCKLRCDYISHNEKQLMLCNNMKCIIDELKLLDAEYANIVGIYKHIISRLIS